MGGAVYLDRTTPSPQVMGGSLPTARIQASLSARLLLDSSFSSGAMRGKLGRTVRWILTVSGVPVEVRGQLALRYGKGG